MASFTILLKDLKYRAKNLYCQKLLSKLIRIFEYSSEKLLSGAIDILAFMLGIMISRTFTELPFSNDVFYYFIIGTSFFVFFFFLFIIAALRIFALSSEDSCIFDYFLNLHIFFRYGICIFFIIVPFLLLYFNNS